MNDFDQIQERLGGALAELENHEATHGEFPADPGQAEHRSRLIRQVEKLGDELDTARAAEDARLARIEAIRNAPVKESGFHAPTPSSRTLADPWNQPVRALSADDVQERAVAALKSGDYCSDGVDQLGTAAEADPHAAAMILARSNPAYGSAFEKLIRNPERAFHTFTDAERRAFDDVEIVRSSLSTSAGTGGVLIPLSLDPQAIVTNAGAANPLRQIATRAVTGSNSHRVITTAGSDAQWLAENTAATDASPTFGKLDISLYKEFQFLSASFEIVADGLLLAQNLAEVAADARDRIEADAFVIGSGSGAPYGVVTRVAAVTASRVTPTTGGVFTANSVADVYKVYDALPARARQSKKLAWIANNATYSLIRQMSPAANGGSFWTDLGGALPSALLGVSRFEASAMDSTMTTGANPLLIGDFSKFTIVDHVSGPSMEFVQNVVNGDGLPTGTRGWIMWHRVGSDVSDTAAFRLLSL